MKEANGYTPGKDPRLINCKTECGNERCFAKRYGLFAEKTCPNFIEPKLITNADRLRAMSDEELAETFDLLTRTRPDTKNDKQSWLDWLKKEADT